MRVVALLVRAVGALLILAGTLWCLQGLGMVMWPAESFMLADSRWALRGALTALVGIGLVWLSFRMRRR